MTVEVALGCVDALGLQIRCEGLGRFQGLGIGCVAEPLACVKEDELVEFSYPHKKNTGFGNKSE